MRRSALIVCLLLGLFLHDSYGIWCQYQPKGKYEAAEFNCDKTDYCLYVHGPSGRYLTCGNPNKPDRCQGPVGHTLEGHSTWYRMVGWFGVSQEGEKHFYECVAQDVLWKVTGKWECDSVMVKSKKYVHMQITDNYYYGEFTVYCCDHEDHCNRDLPPPTTTTTRRTRTRRTRTTTIAATTTYRNSTAKSYSPAVRSSPSYRSRRTSPHPPPQINVKPKPPKRTSSSPPSAAFSLAAILLPLAAFLH